MAGQASSSSQESQKEESLNRLSIYDFLWQVNAYLNEYIQFADAKAGAVVTFFAVVLGLYTGLWPEESKNCCFWLGVVLSLLPIIAALVVITPRLTKGSDQGVIFWGHIVGFEDLDQYANAVKSADFIKEITQQNYFLAKIAQLKYRWLKRAMHATWLALFFLLFSLSGLCEKLLVLLSSLFEKLLVP